jgi:WD40 repeat protein
VLLPAVRVRIQQGHTGKVSCLALSPSGRLLASGQTTYLGYKADIIIWDLESSTLLHRLQLQRVRAHSVLSLGVAAAGVPP